ncbi:hypothetical protein CDL12_28542 [Handroanthus impetiginosus]|uniref:Uncharacterized protein n=1 Tax=Handroanthus impetiginosus TaxID=429701 RepID=A0A2G9G195_9LAMI|nr:hypothetical protein CDL12_28542 [Handroanthus impetiginosus]
MEVMEECPLRAQIKKQRRNGRVGKRGTGGLIRSMMLCWFHQMVLVCQCRNLTTRIGRSDGWSLTHPISKVTMSQITVLLCWSLAIGIIAKNWRKRWRSLAFSSLVLLRTFQIIILLAVRTTLFQTVRSIWSSCFRTSIIIEAAMSLDYANNYFKSFYHRKDSSTRISKTEVISRIRAELAAQCIKICYPGYGWGIF